MTTHVIVDTDTGVDDALALVLMLNSPGVEIVTVHSTHGNCHAEQAANNAKYVLETCGFPDIPVHLGELEPLGPNRGVTSYVHGVDGFGNTGLRPQRPVHGPPSAVDNLIELSKQYDGYIHYVALGPVTNLATALRRDPKVAGRMQSITIVGSLGPAMYGDTEPWNDRRFAISRDPNMSCDIVAAEEISQLDLPITWCGPYVTRQALVPELIYSQIAEETGKQSAYMIRDISQFYADFYTRSYPQPDGRRVMGINDSLAAACVIEPSVILGAVTRPLNLFYDSHGHGHLAGVHPRHPEIRPQHRIVFDVDFDRVIEMTVEALRTSAS